MMEVKEGLASEMTSKGDGMAPEGHVVSPGTENCDPNPVSVLAANPTPSLHPNPNFNCNLNPVPSLSSSPSPSHNPASGPFNGPMMGPTHAVGGIGLKKKRGRPRKLGSDASGGPTISPLSFSATVPIVGQISGWKHSRARCLDSFKKYHAYDEWDSSGEKIAYSVGANFTPHVITINAGEDVTMKIMSFCQNGDRAICILSGNGTISNVTLRQPTSSGGTLTYEGRFEILSLSGSFMPTENGGTKSRSGGMSVSLAGPDGRVVGGGLAGLLVAAGPVQVVVGSFLAGHEQVQKQKNRARTEPPPVSPSGFSPVYPVTGDEVNGAYGVKPILIPPPSFHRDIPASVNPISTVRSFPENSFLPQAEARGSNPPNCDISE